MIKNLKTTLQHQDMKKAPSRALLKLGADGGNALCMLHSSLWVRSQARLTKLRLLPSFTNSVLVPRPLIHKKTAHKGLLFYE